MFGYSAHRRKERALIAWYRGLVEEVLNGKAAPELLTLPENIRGDEGIKAASIGKARLDATNHALTVTEKSTG